MHPQPWTTWCRMGLQLEGWGERIAQIFRSWTRRTIPLEGEQEHKQHWGFKTQSSDSNTNKLSPLQISSVTNRALCPFIRIHTISPGGCHRGSDSAFESSFLHTILPFATLAVWSSCTLICMYPYRTLCKISQA